MLLYEVTGHNHIAVPSKWLNTQLLMSKPLATNVSTILSENVQNRPNDFVWPPLFSSTALTLLGIEFTRASQVATGVLFHSSMTTSQSCWVLETLRSYTFHLRMPHRCSIEFRSVYMLGQSIIFTLSFFSKAVAVIMLEYCPVAQSPKREDHALLQYVTVHVGIHGSLNELLLPSAGSTHAALDHDPPTTMLDCRQDTFVFVLLSWLPPHMLDTIWTK